MRYCELGVACKKDPVDLIHKKISLRTTLFCVKKSKNTNSKLGYGPGSGLRGFYKKDCLERIKCSKTLFSTLSDILTPELILTSI